MTTIHDVVYKRYPETHGVLAKGVEVLVPLAARRSDRVLTDSEASKSDIVRFLGVPARSRRRRAARARDPGGRRRARRRLEIRRRFELGDAPLVLSVLAKRPHKNAARLIEAFARVPERVLVMPGLLDGVRT